MRKRNHRPSVGCSDAVGPEVVSPAYADAAPPQNSPGSSVSSGKFDTKVQMVAESVLMTIDDYVPGDEHQLDMQRRFVRGQVMRRSSCKTRVTSRVVRRMVSDWASRMATARLPRSSPFSGLGRWRRGGAYRAAGDQRRL